MKKIAAFLQIIRWPNLVFIILTQVAFYFFVIQTQSIYIRLQELHFVLLVLASVCIAAGGYIINDYFDINIDIINKPHKLIIGKIFKRRTAIIMHFVLSGLGIILSFYVSIAMQQQWWWVGYANAFITVLLVFYSITLKRKLLSGNIVVALLIAWVILLLVLSQFQLQVPNKQDALLTKEAYSKLFRIGILYASFAFIITLMREVVKDMEDYIGDLNDGCKTMPIVWGFSVSKAFVGFCTVILIALLLILQIYVLQFYWYGAVAYCFILIVLPLFFSLKVLLAAQSTLQFTTLSNLYKAIMLVGILSMIFFKIYA